MKDNINIINISINEFIDKIVADDRLISHSINYKTIEALRNNPSMCSLDDICQIVAINDKEVIGATNCFVNKILIDNKKHNVQSGFFLYTDEKYRKLSVGADIMIKFKNLGQCEDIVLAGISQMALPLYKALKYKIFKFPRFILLKKSRVVLESVLKVNGLTLRGLSILGDLCLMMHNTLLDVYIKIKNKGLTIEKVNEVPDIIEDIIMKDKHKYKECHDKEWFEWNLKYTFSSDERNKKELYVIKKKGDIIGFFVTKIEFHTEAGAGKFHNIFLGSVMEWGSIDETKYTEEMIQLSAIAAFPNYVDGVQFASNDTNTQKKFKSLGFFSAGYANMALFFRSIKDKAINDINNWRIRLSAGDTLIN